MFAFIHGNYNNKKATNVYIEVLALSYYWIVYNKIFIMNANTRHTIHTNDSTYMGCD
jgi:hypothetical protein